MEVGNCVGSTRNVTRHKPKLIFTIAPGQAVVAIASKQNIAVHRQIVVIDPKQDIVALTTIETVFTFTSCSIQDVLTSISNKISFWSASRHPLLSTKP